MQAAISALHCKANSWQDTDWQQITALYHALSAFDPSPVVLLNAAMAQANMGEVEIALKKLETFEMALKSYQPFYAARAEMHVMLGNIEAALADLDLAINLSNNQIERAFLDRKRIKIANRNSGTEN